MRFTQTLPFNNKGATLKFVFVPPSLVAYVIGMKTVVAIFLGSLVAVGPVQAQTSQAPATESAEQAATPEGEAETPNTGQSELVAPYDDKLRRLSEILGAVHYLRTLCGAKEGNKWRDTMAAILKAEEPGPKRRTQLIAHFNRGYRTFNGSYGTCTASAILATERYMKEGALLTKQINNRYGR